MCQRIKYVIQREITLKACECPLKTGPESETDAVFTNSVNW